MVFTTEGFLEVAVEKKQMWPLTKAKTEMKREH